MNDHYALSFKLSSFTYAFNTLHDRLSKCYEYKATVTPGQDLFGFFFPACS